MNMRTLILLAFGLALPSCVQKNEETRINEIDAFLSYQEKLNKFNGTVLIAQNDKVLIRKGYGYRSFEKKIPNDSNSIFQIYSITKTFTSTMILKLIEQNELSLKDPLSKFYPSFPNGENITIQHLLTHTSGINDDAGPTDTLQTEEFRVSLFSKNKPNFAPGEGWSYCNGGYQLLGYIIQKITGMSYEQAIRKNIFEPLDMANSGFDFKKLSRPEKTAAYHVFTNDKKQAAALYDSTGPFAAGSIYSTVGDLYKYYRSFKSHKILTESSQATAFTPSEKNENYGHGWQLRAAFLKPTMIFHGGGAVGFRSYFAIIPEKDICIIILNNHENANTDYLSRKIVDILNNKSVELVQEAPLTTAQLEKLTGAYCIREPQRLMIYTSVVDGRLAITLAGQEGTTVIAKDEDTFIQAEADAVLEFKKDERGEYTELEIDQGSHDMLATKIESAWGLMGDATAKGWDDAIPDIKFIEDKDRKGLLRLKNIALKRGEIKFRLNDDWNIHYGDNKGDKILDMYGETIKIEEGIYDIELNLTDVSTPHYTISQRN